MDNSITPAEERPTGCWLCGSTENHSTRASGLCDDCVENAFTEYRAKWAEEPEDTEDEKELLAARLRLENTSSWWTDHMPGEELTPPLPGYLAALLGVPIDAILPWHQRRYPLSQTAPPYGVGIIAIVRWRFWRPGVPGYVEQSWNKDGNIYIDIRRVENAKDTDLKVLVKLLSAIRRRRPGRPTGPSFARTEDEFKQHLYAALQALKDKGKAATQATVAEQMGDRDARELRRWLQPYGWKLPPRVRRKTGQIRR